MYTGHAGLALLAKGRRPRLSMAAAVVVAFAPDWIEWLFGAKGGYSPDAVLASHGLVSIAFGSILVATLALVLRRPRGDVVALVALYVSHWLADTITGNKPTWGGGPIVGLSLYDHPALDFALEAVVVVACSVAYIRSLPAERRRMAWSVPAALIVLQAGFNVVMRGISGIS